MSMASRYKKQKVDNEQKKDEDMSNAPDSVPVNPTALPTDDTSIVQKFLKIEEEQSKELLKLQYGQGQLLVFNPLDYASELHRDFVTKFCQGPKKLLLLGMNPGPWGMGQTGVPFGHVDYARDWLGVRGEVSSPKNEHPKRLIKGLNCTRKEVSGERMWSLLKQLSGSPEVLFTNVFLHNYCPLYFLKESAKNVTPPELKVQERVALEAVCDQALVRVVEVLGVEHVVGVGKYAATRAGLALCNGGREDVKVSTLMHPSPVNPAANKGWINIAIKQLTESEVIEYFKPTT